MLRVTFIQFVRKINTETGHGREHRVNIPILVKPDAFHKLGTILIKGSRHDATNGKFKRATMQGDDNIIVNYNTARPPVVVEK